MTYEKVTALKSSARQKKYFPEKKAMQQAQKNKHHCLLADPPEIGISEISEDVKKEKKTIAGFSRMIIAFGCKCRR